ncbi:MAG TPA: hydrogenase [Verrucomicrobia bacterium]|nr:MAG: hydrogenase [Lentisphaerae bacterium GWF2_57_35]HBA86206.1 hydrogenase [Verrucomicrobiota bacterium]
MTLLLLLFPACMALVALAIPSNRLRPWVLPVTTAVHLALTLLALLRPAGNIATSWIALDPLGKLVLLLISVLYFITSFYLVGYLHYRHERSNRIVCACLLSGLSAMTLLTWAHHLGIMWVAIETTALSTAPLIYFNHTPRSIEAAWKYLLIGSVGIALALLGSFFLAYASLRSGLPPTLLLGELLREAPQLSKPWLHAAFVLMLVGYGTKMGLAPMHTWKPDAYGEAPGAIGALLAGGVTSCAFLCILRIYHICLAAGDGPYVAPMLLFMGLLSMAIAGIFMVGQQDYKRMLAYSSVEHMGILILGLGLGGAAALFGTLLHMINNGLTKGVLFLSAGNIHRSYNSAQTSVVHGALRRLPLSGGLFLTGFLAITGSPPFAPFISEFSIFNAAIDSGHWIASGLFLLFLLVIFIGMGATVLRIVQGSAPESTPQTPYRDSLFTTFSPIVFLGLALLLGLAIPSPLNHMLMDAVHYLEVQP